MPQIEETKADEYRDMGECEKMASRCWDCAGRDRWLKSASTWRGMADLDDINACLAAAAGCHLIDHKTIAQRMTELKSRRRPRRKRRARAEGSHRIICYTCGYFHRQGAPKNYSGTEGTSR